MNNNKPLYYSNNSKYVYLYDGQGIEKATYDHVWSTLSDLLENRILTPGASFTAEGLASSRISSASHDDVERSLIHIALGNLLPICLVPAGEGRWERFEVI